MKKSKKLNIWQRGALNVNDVHFVFIQGGFDSGFEISCQKWRLFISCFCDNT